MGSRVAPSNDANDCHIVADPHKGITTNDGNDRSVGGVEQIHSQMRGSLLPGDVLVRLADDLFLLILSSGSFARLVKVTKCKKENLGFHKNEEYTDVVLFI